MMPAPRFLVRNAGLKALSVVIAVAVWFALSGERRERTSERSYHIPLSIVNIPPHTLIASPLPGSVDVRLRGPFTALRQLEPDKLDAVLDLKDAEKGDRVYRFTQDDVNVPSDVEVIAISPQEIRFVLDTVEEKRLPVAPVVTGKPAAGMRLAEVRAEPDTAVLAGPAGALARMSSVPTAPVPVEGRASSFSMPVAVLAEGPGLRVRQGQIVTVTVRLEPEPTPSPIPSPARSRRRP
jgi:hypothetical protein